MFEKFDVNKFYVGELILSENIDSMLSDSANKENRAKKDLKEATECSGAIPLNYSLLTSEIDFKRKLVFHRYLTIFHKTMNGYMCLHNGLVYETNKEDGCQNLVKLTSLLPKIDYDVPNEISNFDSINMFNSLFGVNNSNTIMTNEVKHDISEYYVGRLCLCDGLDTNMCNTYGLNGFINMNTIYDKMMIPNMARCVGMNGIVSGKMGCGTFYYTIYKGLFMKHNNALLFIHDNQEYKIGFMNGEGNIDNVGETYFDSIIPYEEELNKKGKGDIKTLTLSEAKSVFNSVR